MLRDLYIIGAGGCGREVLQWVKDINSVTPTWNIKGFLNDDLNALNEKICSHAIVTKVDDFPITPNVEFVCAIGDGAARKSIIQKLEAKGAKFATVVHPTALVAETAKLGKAVILYPYALISDNAVVGDGGIINMYSSVAHDSVLGNFCTISAHCDITGACTLGEQVFMGTTSNLIPRTAIGDRVCICAGSTVMASVRSGRKVLGNPAKIVNL